MIVDVPEPYTNAVYTVLVPVPDTRNLTIFSFDELNVMIPLASLLLDSGGVKINEPSDVILFRSGSL